MNLKIVNEKSDFWSIFYLVGRRGFAIFLSHIFRVKFIYMFTFAVKCESHWFYSVWILMIFNLNIPQNIYVIFIQKILIFFYTSIWINITILAVGCFYLPSWARTRTLFFSSIFVGRIDKKIFSLQDWSRPNLAMLIWR